MTPNGADLSQSRRAQLKTPEMQDEIDLVVDSAHRSDEHLKLSDSLIESLLGHHTMLLEAGPLDAFASTEAIHLWGREREIPVEGTWTWKLNALKEALTEAFDSEWGDVLEAHVVRHRDGREAFVLGHYYHADHGGEARSTLGIYPVLDALFLDIRARGLAYRLWSSEVDLTQLRANGAVREFEELTEQDVMKVWAD